MTGFDIPSLGNFDPTQFQRQVLTVGNTPAGGVQDPERVLPRPSPAADRGPDGGDFAGLLADSIDRVRALRDEAQQKTRSLALGEDVDLHDVMIATNKGEVAFNLLLEVRNKLVDAWDKLSRSVM